MPTCEKCGSSVDLGSRFCPGCGAPMTTSPEKSQRMPPRPPSDSPPSSPSAPPPPPPLSPLPRPAARPARRPSLIAVLAALLAIFSLVLFLFGALAIAAFTTSGVDLAGLAVSTTLIVPGLMMGFSAYGLWTGKKWAYWLLLVLGILGMVSYFVLGIVPLILGLILIVYLRLPHVMAWFRW